MTQNAAALLTPERQDLLDRVRAVLGDLRTKLSSGLADAEAEATVRASIDQLDDPFLLVIVGEFNAGKSTLINSLVGERILEDGVTPTTTTIQILRHQSQKGRPAGEGVSAVVGTAALLHDVHLVDTPGTNTITREHEALTERFVPRADLILFTTSADRPFTESERGFMERIREWGKNVVVVVNKADIMTAATDHDRVMAFVKSGIQSLLGFTPEMFAVSAKRALEAKRDGDEARLTASGVPTLERYILTTLDDRERFRLKLLNPIGVGLRLVAAAREAMGSRQRVLAKDLKAVEEIQSLLTGYRRSLDRGLELRLAEVDNVLLAVEKRGDDFFDETVRLGRLVDLLNRSKLRADFEREVIADLATAVEKRVEGVIDWLVADGVQQWREVRERLVRRKTEHAERVALRLADGFEYDRTRLLEAVGKTVQGTLDRHDRRAESARMADSVQNAVANAALLEVGAVGLGTVVTTIASSTAVDVTGTLAAGALATLGVFVIPRRRRRAKRELRERIALLRARLTATLMAQFEREVTASVRRIEVVLTPYLQFVEGERVRLQQRTEELAAIETRFRGLRDALGD